MHFVAWWASIFFLVIISNLQKYLNGKKWTGMQEFGFCYLQARFVIVAQQWSTPDIMTKDRKVCLGVSGLSPCVFGPTQEDGPWWQWECAKGDAIHIMVNRKQKVGGTKATGVTFKDTTHVIYCLLLGSISLSFQNLQNSTYQQGPETSANVPMGDFSC